MCFQLPVLLEVQGSGGACAHSQKVLVVSAFLEFGQIGVSTKNHRRVGKQSHCQSYNLILGDETAGVPSAEQGLACLLPGLPAFSCMAGVPMIYYGLVIHILKTM